MIERGTTGGTCVNTGCVPSKALLAAAAARHTAAGARFPGIITQAGAVDMAALTAGKDDLAAAMRAGKYADLAAGYGWEIVAGTARFAGTADSPILEVGLNTGGATTIEAARPDDRRGPRGDLVAVPDHVRGVAARGPGVQPGCVKTVVLRGLTSAPASQGELS